MTFDLKTVARLVLLTLTAFISVSRCFAEEPPADANALPTNLHTGQFRWQVSPPLFAPIETADDEFYSVKDPSAVYFDGAWHLFCTIRGKNRSHQIEYITFTDWNQIDKAKRQMLAMHAGFYCAPQVFY